MADMIPIEWAFIEGIVLLIPMAFFLFKWIGSKDQSEEGKIFAKCRDNNLPCLKVTDISTGHAKYYAGEKDEDGDPMFEIPGLPMKIDPSMCTGDSRPERFGAGLNIWSYCTPKALPLSVDSILAYKTMTDHRKDRAAFKLLGEVPDAELYSLIRISKKHVMAAADLYIAKYELKGTVLSGEEEYLDDVVGEVRVRDDPPMPTNEFTEIIEQMKSYFAALPVETGFYCVQAAFAATPFAAYSQEIERIKYLLEQKANIEAANNAKLMQYAFMFCMIIAAVGGLVAILLVLAPHGG